LALGYLEKIPDNELNPDYKLHLAKIANSIAARQN